MPLYADLQNPPAYLVQCGMTGREMTWPFDTQEEAAAAYRMAVLSGQFKHEVRKATKKQPAVTVDLVSMWRREYHPHVQTGELLLTYVGCEPWHKEPAADAGKEAS